MARTWSVRFAVFAMLFMAVECAAYVRPTARENSSRKKLTQVEQVHVSLTGPNYMKVSWMVSTSGMNALPTVQYGLTSGNFSHTAHGETLNYTYLLYRSGQIHHVKLGPLQDNTTYYYKCGGVSQEFKFTTPPPAGPDVPIKFAVVGDLGQTGWTESTLKHIGDSNYDVLLLAGDLSYADYYQPRWDSFGRLVTPYASAKPWMVTQGNHDVEGIPLVVDSFRAYNTRWQMPYAESGSKSNLYYSFEVAGAHVIMLGSYTEYGRSSSQFKWLNADLAKVDRSRTPWLIAVLHAPWYNTNYAHQGNGDAMKADLEKVLYEAKVDFLFGGHVHAYERMVGSRSKNTWIFGCCCKAHGDDVWGEQTRVYDNKVDPCGIIHITVGDGGNREGLATRYYDNHPDWSLFREASFGHGQLQLVNSTHAHWSWHRNDDDEAVLADEVWVTSLSWRQSECSCMGQEASVRRLLRRGSRIAGKVNLACCG